MFFVVRRWFTVSKNNYSRVAAVLSSDQEASKGKQQGLNMSLVLK